MVSLVRSEGDINLPAKLIYEIEAVNEKDLADFYRAFMDG
jgi:hypothetical protein